MSGLQVDGERWLISLARGAEFIETLVEGIIVVDDKGVVVDCNKAAGEILLVETNDLLGANIFEPQLGNTYEDGSPIPLSENPFMVTLQTGEACHDVTIGVDLPSARRWLRTETTPLTLKGSGRGALIAFADITPQVWMERNYQFFLYMNQIVIGANSVPKFFESLCTGFVEVARCDLASISFDDFDHPGAIETLYAAGATDFLYEGMGSWLAREEDGLGPTGTAMRTRVTQVANLLDTYPGYEPWRERAQKFGFKSLVAVPFTFGQRTGVLTLTSSHSHAFDELALRGLDAVAREIEFGISHLGAVEKLAKALDGTLAVLAEMTESRDPYTEGHQIHVGSLGAAIATHLGLDATMIELIRQSGEVHDVGKIAVPAEILTRPGRLGFHEFELVKTHTTLGADILSKASLPWPLAEVALQHHERMDGSGYPNGLLGSEIIQPAKIIAVADVVEAMTRHRPYRAGLGIDKALDEVSRGAGTSYDADVVKACLAVFAAGFTFESPDELDSPLRVD
jgi:HD-GYP domain-containing protein (c-di-GMP phosphodiesterase class II)